jgi:transcriptional regulator GlxA family with amidase domain
LGDIESGPAGRGVETMISTLQSTRGRSLLVLLLVNFLGCSSRAQSGSDAFELKKDLENVGILVWKGAAIYGVTPAWDVWVHTKKANVFLVAETAEPIESKYGLKYHPHFSFDNAPPIDVLVIPSGGHEVVDNERLLAWVRKAVQRAKYVTSNCTGAYLLAAAGVLDGKVVTTFPISASHLAKRYPKIKKVIGEARVVQDGKFVTNPSTIPDFETQLFLVRTLLGEETAKKVAKDLVYGPENIRASLDPIVVE